MRRRRENKRAGIEHVGKCASVVLWLGWNFGERSVADGADEFFELPVGDRGAVDPKTADRDPVDRRFFRIMLIRPHAERAAVDPNHVWRR